MLNEEPGTLPPEDAPVPSESPVVTPPPAPKRRAPAAPPRRTTAGKKAARKGARPRKPVAPPKSSSAKTPAQAGPAKSATGAKARAGRAFDASAMARVKAGSVDLWVPRPIASALTAKDRKKLKAVLKRARKRAKAEK
jgi:hypothetical protein